MTSLHSCWLRIRLRLRNKSLLPVQSDSARVNLSPPGIQFYALYATRFRSKFAYFTRGQRERVPFLLLLFLRTIYLLDPLLDLRCMEHKHFCRRSFIENELEQVHLSEMSTAMKYLDEM